MEIFDIEPQISSRADEPDNNFGTKKFQEVGQLVWDGASIVQYCGEWTTSIKSTREFEFHLNLETNINQDLVITHTNCAHMT